MIVRSGYDENDAPDVAQAKALFAIADAMRSIAKALSYGGGEGMSVSEAITLAARDIAERPEE